ncbi:Ral GTPase-activating protein subunit alpha-1 [Schistosoma japonicum]|nr:Ral GTPase-activating protein subunit alpha-1 [Schistosoma japonicum]KAH8861020.1 Ral GTPase-activating protein subunit alpha-1 [Schistosoma japonicum]
MFRRHRPSDISTLKSRKKFLSDKESTHKIKHLKILIDNLPHDELQPFFVENSSLIFQVFSDCFFSIEWDVKLRGSSNCVKDLEVALIVFEKILLLLPEHIHQRWQHNCIIEIIEDLLYEKNALTLRKRGIRLFLIWYQILGLNASTVCHKLFNNLVPEFGSLIKEYQDREKCNEQPKRSHVQPGRLSVDARGQVIEESRISNVVAPRERVALLTAAAIEEDESTDDVSLVLFQALLRFLVSESFKVEWSQLRYEQHLMQLWFLFEKLKYSYLPVIFPCLSPLYSIYSPLSEVNNTFQLTSNILHDYPIHPSRLSYYQLELVYWLASFVYTGPRSSSHTVSSDGGPSSNSVTHGSVVGTTGTSFNVNGSFPWDTHGDPNDFLLSRHFRSFIGCPGHGDFESGSYSKANSYSKLSTSPVQTSGYMRYGDDNFSPTSFPELADLASQNIYPTPNSYLPKTNFLIPSAFQTSPLLQKFIFTEPIFNYSDKVVSMVHEVLYGCRQNINLVQDILHQALLLPLHCHKAISLVIMVYGSWLENKQNRPIFMQALDTPIKNSDQLLKSVYASQSIEENRAFQINNHLSDFKQIQQSQAGNSPTDKMKPEDNASDPEELKGCLQNTIQIMLENMANVFYASSLDVSFSGPQNTNRVATNTADYTKHQIDLCRLVLQVFQFASNSNELTRETWSKLLSILMDIMSRTMINTSPTNVQNYKWLLNNKLTQNLFQTLNGALLRASLFSTISSEPWDQCLNVYSKLMHWPSLIIEWKKVMRMLTCTMAKLVYGVDLSDLPQEKKRPRFKRLAASTNSASRARPKSLTESALNYNNNNNPNINSSASVLLSASVAYPSALSIANFHQNSLDDNLILNSGCTEPDNNIGDNRDISRDLSKNMSATCSDVKALQNHDHKPSIEKWTSETAHHETTNTDEMNNMINNDNTRSHSSINYDGVADDQSNLEECNDDSTVMNNIKHRHNSQSFPHDLLTKTELVQLKADAKDKTLMSERRRLSFVRRATSEVALEVKFGLDSPESPVRTYFSESQGVNGLDILRSYDRPNNEGTNLQLSRQDTLTATQEVPIANGSSKVATAAANDQLNTVDVPRCILAGGPAFGWTNESIVICWRRFLGVLGNFHKITNPTTLSDIFSYLTELTTCLLKIREYQTVPCSTDTCIQPIPHFVPPIDFISPILFDSMNLSEDFLEAKQIAIRALIDIAVFYHDGYPNLELIARFFHLIHQISVTKHEKFIFEVVRSCNIRMFVSPLPSTHLLILDFLSNANVVLANPNPGTEIPRSDALSVVLSLICYPYHFNRLESIDPMCTELKTIVCQDLTSQLIHILTQSVLSDPSAEVRCLAITGLSIFCVTELINSSSKESGSVSSTGLNSLFFDSIIILLGMMRFQNRIISIVAVDMINMLADYCHLLLLYDVRLSCLVLLSLAWTLYSAWDNANLNTISSTDKRFFLSLLQAIIEWSMHIPYDQLIKKFENKTESSLPALNLLDTVIEVLCYIASNDTNSQCLLNSQNSNITQPKYLPSIYFTDPLLEHISTCKQSIDIKLFYTTESELDLSSLTTKYWIGTNSVNTSIESTYHNEINHPTESVRLAARMTISHLLNHIDQFPVSKHGAQLNSSIQEHHDQLAYSISTQEHYCTNNVDDASELTADIFERNNVQIFVLNRSVILTFISLPNVVKSPSQLKNTGDTTADDKFDAALSNELHAELNSAAYSYLPLSYLNPNIVGKMSSKSGLVTDKSYTRIITRDLSGKYCWDASYLYGSIYDYVERRKDNQLQFDELANADMSLMVDSSDLDLDLSRDPPPCPPPRVNPPRPPLTDENTSHIIDTFDRLNDVLRDLALTSPECSINWCTLKPSEYENVKKLSDKELTARLNMEKMTYDQITAQCQMDDDTVHRKLADVDVLSLYDSYSLQPTRHKYSLKNTIHSVINNKNPNELESIKQNTSQFYNSRHLLNQLGYVSWRYRSTVDLLQKSPALVRELKHLDNLGSRETHKFAVFYVGAGQEDKQSILANQTASLEFENFVAGLGWEINLLTHKGFRGGLERSGRAGLSTPYYATSTLEVIYHVSTRMPSSTHEDLKYKHLGNDEVMIIWNENSRAFRRSVLRTQFGDVLIIISPLLNGLYKVEVRREAQIGLFGPIVENAILCANVLPGLVRATAINASRAVQATKPGYRRPYEDRASSLQQIISKHTLSTSFEEYTESILFPSSKTGSVMSMEQIITRLYAELKH